MDECIFCKIVKGEIPSSKLYENEKVLVFLDILPVSKGHTLVIPKAHYANLLETPDEILAEIVKTIKKVAPAILKGTQSEGFNIGVNTNPSAGQVVFHTHFHIMPRSQGDHLRLWKGKSYPQGEMERLAEEIKKYVAE